MLQEFLLDSDNTGNCLWLRDLRARIFCTRTAAGRALYLFSRERAGLGRLRATRVLCPPWATTGGCPYGLAAAAHRLSIVEVVGCALHTDFTPKRVTLSEICVEGG